MDKIPAYESPGRSRSHLAMWSNLGICSASAVATAGYLIHISNPHQLSGMDLWVCSSFAGVACLAVIFRNDRAGSMVTLIAALLAAGLMAWTIYGVQTSTSSTAPLDLLVEPVLAWGGVVVAAVIVGAIKLCRRIGV